MAAGYLMTARLSSLSLGCKNWGGALMNACCRRRISDDRQWRARGAGRGTSVLVGKRDCWLAWKRCTWTQKGARTHTHTHKCGQDKVPNCGLSELPGAQPSTHAALGFLSQSNIVPHYKKKHYSRFVDDLFVRFSDDCSNAHCSAFVCFLP